MTIEQTLYGYYKGHGLLASSFVMKPSDDSSLMSILSDWTGFHDENEEDAYMTFYPLEQGEKYAIAKTWYASEMERPGCVWTHTLIVDLKNIDRDFDFRVLNDYFRRPTKDNYEYYQKAIEIDDFEKRNSNVVFQSFDGVSLLVLFVFLLCENKKLAIRIDRSQSVYAELCLYFIQYLPIDILKETSFSTGSSTYRKCGEQDFSIQFVDDTKSLDLAVAPWKEKLSIEDLDEGLLYVYEESQKENDQLPSLIRLFSKDIADDKDKFIGFVILMKNLSAAIKGNAETCKFTDILNLLIKYFPKEDDGLLLKYNFFSQEISSLFGSEKDILYQIAAFENTSGLFLGLVDYKNRIKNFSKEHYSDYILLINDIAKLKKPNKYACQVLAYSIDTLDEKELMAFILPNWDSMFPLVGNSERFFDSGMWLHLPSEQFRDLVLKYSSNNFEKFNHWDDLLNRTIESEALVEETLSMKMIDNVENSIDIVLDAANSDSYKFLSPFLLQACLTKMEKFLEWLREQGSINKRIEKFIIYQVNPNDILLKSTSSKNWSVLLRADNGLKDFDFYVFMYILAHNWMDDMSISLLKHSFIHIYNQLSENLVNDETWNKLEAYTSSVYKIEKWDKCKILSRGLVDFLKQCDIAIDDLYTFTPNMKINEKLGNMWKK